MKQFEVDEQCWNDAQLGEVITCGNVTGTVATKRSTDGKYYVILTNYTEI